VAQEVNRWLQVVFAEWHKTGQIDLEAVEMLLRTSLHRAGAATLQRLLCMPVAHECAVPCPCGRKAHYHETRRKQVLTMLGPVIFDRAYFVCPDCHAGQSPRDRELDVVGSRGLNPSIENKPLPPLPNLHPNPFTALPLNRINHFRKMP